MISTRRGLYVLAAIAGLLAAILVVDLRRARSPVDHALLPGFDESSVMSIHWSAHPMGPYLGIERATSAAPWRRAFPTVGEVEPRVIADVLATLRGARWQRMRDTVESPPVMLELAMSDGKKVSLSLGGGVPNDAQEWISIDGRGYLVDKWVTRALLPSPLDVAVRRPLVAIPDADRFQLGAERIGGHPRRHYTATDVSGVVLDPTFVDEIEKTIASLELVALSTRPLVAGAGSISITGAGTEAAIGGACNDDPLLVALVTPSGGGCVRAADAAAITAIVARLHGAPSDIAAKQLVPFAPLTITLADKSVLDLTKRPRIGTVAANDTAVAELLATLSVPSQVVREATSVAGPTIVVTGRAGQLELQVDPTRHLVKRNDDRVVLELTEHAMNILLRPASAYEEVTLWNEEPSTITRYSVSGRAFSRGDVVGEWGNSNQQEEVEKLATLIANPTVLGRATKPATSTRDIVLITIKDPTGAERSHEMAVYTVGDECIAVARVTVRIDPAICDTIPKAR